MRHLDSKIYGERKILCGTPPHFQGGERHVIFISIVDSPDPSGGPLARRGDGPRDLFKKRFNVAASRAKDQMWVVHSLEPGYDLHGFNEDLRSRLIMHARTASELPSRIERLAKRTRSPFEVSVAEKLLSVGYEVEAAWMVGKLEIDLVVTGDNGDKLAIECDGEQFHPPEKLSEDLARQRILESRGWKFERIRGSAFYRDEDSAMTPVFSRLDALGIYPRAADNTDPSHQDEKHQELRRRVEARARDLRDDWEYEGDIATEQYKPPVEPIIQPIDSTQNESQRRPSTEVSSINPTFNRTQPLLEHYTITDLSSLHVGHNLQSADPADLLNLIVEVAKKEGPVHQDIMLNRIRETYGLRKLRGSTRENAIAAIRSAVRDGNIGRIDDFLCIDSMQFSYPARQAGDRKITEISQRELSKAISVVLAQKPSLQRDQLIKEVVTQLGYDKVGSTIKSVLENLVQ